MTVLFADSFDHYAIADRLLKWTANCGNQNIAIGAGLGRNGTSALRYNTESTGLRKTVINNIVTGGVAWAFKMAAVKSASYPEILILLDGTARQIEVRLSPTGVLTVTRNGSLLGTASALFTPAVFHHLELQVTIHPSAGVVKLWLDSILVLNLAGQNTRATANSQFNGFVLGNLDVNIGQPANSLDWDDVILWETDPVGDCRVECLFPTGAGATTGMTPSAGANWACVDDATPNNETDYVATAVPGTFDTYAMADLSTAAGTVKAVQTVLYARKDDAGAHTVNSVTRSGGIDYDGAALPLTTSYAMLVTIESVDPATGVAWAIAGVNAAEFGAKMAS